MLERDVEQYLVEQVEARGGQADKIKFVNRRGAPDRLVVLPSGAVWLIETKRPSGGRLSYHQKEFAENLPLKAPYRLLWTIEQVDVWLRAQP